MRASQIIATVMAVGLSIGLAYAEPAEETSGNTVAKRLKAEAELSFVNTSGNTQVTSLSAKNAMTYALTKKLTGTWRLHALYAETDGQRSAESYSTQIRMDYLFTDRLYGAGRGGWEKDQFAGIENRYYTGPLIGYHFLTGPKHRFRAEAGVDYVSEMYTDDTDSDFFDGRAFAAYEWAFAQNTKFTQELEYLVQIDETDNYKINSLSALITTLSNILSLKVGYEIKFDNAPVPDTLEKTDTILAVTLIVNY